nr:MAG TPA: hypothetical protein [Caudoviricetes sp.]
MSSHNSHRLLNSVSCFLLNPSTMYKIIDRIHIKQLISFWICKILVTSKISLHLKEILTLLTSIDLSILYQTI